MENLKISDLKGVNKIVFVKNGIEKTLQETSEPGRTIFLIDPFPLEHRDMLKVMHMSQEPVGIIGNCTFSESLNRLPFYNNRRVLANFWEGLINLCEKTSPKSVELIRYLREMKYSQSTEYTHTPKDIAMSPENLPILKQQWTEFVNIIKRDWNVRNAYIGEINYQMYLKDPSKVMYIIKFNYTEYKNLYKEKPLTVEEKQQNREISSERVVLQLNVRVSCHARTFTCSACDDIRSFCIE